MSERTVVEASGAPEAAGPYSHATLHGGVLYCSGQVSLDPETGELIDGGPGEQTTRCLRNLEAICEEAGTSLSRALMVSVFTTDLAAGPEINAAYGEAFAAEPPARAMVGVAGLPLGASVEIAAVVAVG
ncbi:MAG: Rid family detoxifying hydrolase [Actinomycetota bacterium]|nr:Rid family detoxifying hydrolase [Actinomycetota bacterium]